MGRYDKVNDADTRGQYFEPDADWEVTISRVVDQDGTNGRFFVVECIVDKCDNYPGAVGEQRVWLQRTHEKKVPWERELRAFAAAAFAFDAQDKTINASKLLDAACDDGVLNGVKIKLTTQGMLTKESKKPFTRHIWKQNKKQASAA